MADQKRKYRVKPGQTVIHGVPDPKGGRANNKSFGEGDEIELTDEEAASMPHAIEAVTSKKGKTRRESAIAKRRQELEDELRALDEAEDEPRKPSTDDRRARKEARDSVRNRPDNMMSGVVPSWKVPKAQADAAEAALLAPQTAPADDDDADVGPGFDDVQTGPDTPPAKRPATPTTPPQR